MDIPSEPVTDKELEVFRNAWRAELSTLLLPNAKPRNKDQNITSDSIIHAATTNPTNPHGSVISKASQIKDDNLLTSICDHPHVPMLMNTNVNKSFELYEHALELEIMGQLSDALTKYRTAFKLNPDVDIQFLKKINHQPIRITNDIHSEQATTKSHGSKPTNNNENNTIISITTLIKDLQIDPSSSLIQSMDPNQIHPIILLPEELLLHVFQHLFTIDIHSFYTISLVCKRFLILARESTVWRYVCKYHYPHRKDEIDSLSINSWIDFFRTEPRLRIDGVYISSCRYIRPGYSETSMNAPILIVEYYRYLRFYRNGTVIAYMTTIKPRDIVRNFNITKLESTRGFQLGTYTLQDDQVIIKLTENGRPMTQFNVILRIRGSKRRLNRISRLEWQKYTIHTCTSISPHPKINLDDDDSVELNLSEYKPYVFSKVNSYIAIH